jgi:glycosyltransferase involved in cell wall biosynthesis
MSKNENRVLFVGDSRKMKGGVSSVMKNISQSDLWTEWNCYWLENQINSGLLLKIVYFFRGLIYGLFIIPRYSIIHFQTAPGRSLIVNMPLMVYANLWKRKIITQLHVGNQIKDHLDDASLKFWVTHSDLVLLLGKQWRDIMYAKFPIKGRFEYVYNPVEIRERQLAPQKYFLYAAYFNINKGASILLNAFREVVKEFPDWKLVMCGSGNDEKVCNLLKQCDFAQSIILPGWVSGKQKEEYFRNAYAYCMTSYKEGLPMSVLEAMSYGVPVITTPVGCLPEILTDEQSCLFFQFGNAEQLALQMKRLILDQELRQNLSIQSYNIAAAEFSISAIARRLHSFYMKLIHTL